MQFPPKYERLNQAEHCGFDVEEDKASIFSYMQAKVGGKPVKLAAIPKKPNLFRAYFLDRSNIIMAILDKLGDKDMSVLRLILESSGPPAPIIKVFVLSNKKVCFETKINERVLAYVLFKFHNKQSKSWLFEDYQLGLL